MPGTHRSHLLNGRMVPGAGIPGPRGQQGTEKLLSTQLEAWELMELTILYLSSSFFF